MFQRAVRVWLFPLFVVVDFCVLGLWENMSELESRLLTTTLSINPGIVDVERWMRGWDQTPVKRSPRSQSSYCMSDSHASHLEQRSTRSCSHFLKAYLNSQTKSCCSAGTYMHTHTARRLCFLFNWKMNIFVIPIPRPSGVSAHYQVTGSTKPRFFRRFDPVGKMEYLCGKWEGYHSYMALITNYD